MKDLEEFRVPGIDRLYYVPDYVDTHEEEALMKQVYAAPSAAWKQVKGRRLLNLGGLVHAKGLVPTPMPPWLKEFTRRLREDVPMFPKDINHVLVNEYQPGQGILGVEPRLQHFPGQDSQRHRLGIPVS